MRATLLLVPCLLSSAVMAETTTFEADVIGQPPAGWTCGATGRGNPKWSVEADHSHGVAARSCANRARQPFRGASRATPRSPTAGSRSSSSRSPGREDQAGGVVWRWKDGDNYYVARANALENNVSLYYTERGSRKTLKYVDAPVAPGQWHTLRVEFAGAQDRRLARRQALHRPRRQPHRRRRRGRRLDQGRQRHGFDDFAYEAR